MVEEKEEAVEEVDKLEEVEEEVEERSKPAAESKGTGWCTIKILPLLAPPPPPPPPLQQVWKIFSRK